MRFTVLLLVVGFAAAAALYRKPQRIVGGSTTTIQEYPYGASLLRSWLGAFFNQACGGSILNVKSILTAAHCPFGDSASRWRVRVGSTFANSGGVVVNTALVIIHPSYSNRNLDNDIAILRLSSNLVYSSSVGPASIAHYNYNLKDNEDVWAIGWGATSFGSSGSETLRHVQIKTINQELCRSRYQERGDIVTENMLCSGLLDVGGRDQCQGDSGGPLIHYNVVVGICSWGHQCAHPRFPGVNVRVSRYMSWIQENA